MDFALIWTEHALIDLSEVVRFYREERASPESANKIGSAIIEHIEVLRTFPDIVPRYPKKDGLHREVLCYEYRIFYRVDRDAKIVYIVRVWHGRQNPDLLTL